MAEFGPVDYQAQKIDFDFKVDGDPDKSVWATANWSRPFVDMATGERPEFETRSAILWSESKLYIAMIAEESDIRAELTERDSLIFLESDLELLIDGGESYYELEVNALNTIYEVFFIWRDSLRRTELFPPAIFDISGSGVYTFGGDYDRSGANFWNGTHPRGVRWAFREFDLPGLETAVGVKGNLNNSELRDESWSLEISIPWQSLKYLANGRTLPPKDGDLWRFFLGRFQKQIVAGREISPHPASSLRSHGVYDTHIPEEWSVIEFKR